MPPTGDDFTLTISLTDVERQFMALALQGIAVRQGPVVFPFCMALAEKLQLTEYLEGYLQSWTAFAADKPDMPDKEAPHD